MAEILRNDINYFEDYLSDDDDDDDDDDDSSLDSEDE